MAGELIPPPLMFFKNKAIILNYSFGGGFKSHAIKNTPLKFLNNKAIFSNYSLAGDLNPTL